MKKWIFIMMACLTVSIQTYATDYTVLEALIASHKAQSNRLKERIETEGSVAVTQTLDTKNSKKYEEVVSALRKRYGDVADLVIFAGELVHITNLTQRVVSKEVTAVDLALQYSTRHPRLLVKAVKLQTEFGKMVEEMASMTVYITAAGLGATMSNAYQRKQFCNFMSSRLSNMNVLLTNFIYYAECVGPSGVNIISWMNEANKARLFNHSLQALEKVKREIDNIS